MCRFVWFTSLTKFVFYLRLWVCFLVCQQNAKTKGCFSSKAKKEEPVGFWTPSSSL